MYNLQKRKSYCAEKLFEKLQFAIATLFFVDAVDIFRREMKGERIISSRKGGKCS